MEDWNWWYMIGAIALIYVRYLSAAILDSLEDIHAELNKLNSNLE